jgi:hypothetical protein
MSFKRLIDNPRCINGLNAQLEPLQASLDSTYR